MTSHDREFLNRIVGRIIEIDGGVSPATGQPRLLRAGGPERDQAGRLTNASRRCCQGDALPSALQGPAAKASQVQSRVKARQDREGQPPKRRRTLISSSRPRLLRRGRQGRTGAQALWRAGRPDGSIFHPAAGPLGDPGVNGAGKSTLLKLIAGRLRRTGTVSSTERPTGPFRPARDAGVRQDRSVYESLEEPRSPASDSLTLAGCFGFSGGDVDKTCRILSGGEKARLVLARILYARLNFLVLDELTNHLDIATKDMIVRRPPTTTGPCCSCPIASFSRSCQPGLELGPTA
jgi:ATPase subunit of ABC transporter with duplicated ATPase domains